MDQIYVGTPVEFHVVEDHSGKNGGKRRATNVRLPPSRPEVIGLNLRPGFGSSGAVFGTLTLDMMPGGKLAGCEGVGEGSLRPGGAGMGMGAGLGAGISTGGGSDGGARREGGVNGGARRDGGVNHRRCGGNGGGSGSGSSGGGGSGGGGGGRRGCGGTSVGPIGWGAPAGSSLRDIQRQQSDLKSAAGRKLTNEGRLETRPLLSLLRARSPEEITQFLDDVFTHRDGSVLPARCTELASTLKMSSIEEELIPLIECAKAMLWQLTESPSRPVAGLFLRQEVTILLPFALSLTKLLDETLALRPLPDETP